MLPRPRLRSRRCQPASRGAAGEAEQGDADAPAPFRSIQALAHVVVGSLPQPLRARAAAQYGAGILSRLTEVTAAWCRGTRRPSPRLAAIECLHHTGLLRVLGAAAASFPQPRGREPEWTGTGREHRHRPAQLRRRRRDWPAGTAGFAIGAVATFIVKF